MPAEGVEQVENQVLLLGVEGNDSDRGPLGAASLDKPASYLGNHGFGFRLIGAALGRGHKRRLSETDRLTPRSSVSGAGKVISRFL